MAPTNRKNVHKYCTHKVHTSCVWQHEEGALVLHRPVKILLRLYNRITFLCTQKALSSNALKMHIVNGLVRSSVNCNVLYGVGVRLADLNAVIYIHSCLYGLCQLFRWRRFYYVGCLLAKKVYFCKKTSHWVSFAIFLSSTYSALKMGSCFCNGLNAHISHV